MTSYPGRGWITPAEIKYKTLVHIDDEWAHALIVELRPEGTLIIGAARERRLEMGDIRASSLAPVCEDALRKAEDMTGRIIGHIVVPDEALISICGPYLTSIACAVRSKRPDPARAIGQRELRRLFQRLYRTAAERAASASDQQKDPSNLELLQAEVLEAQVDGLAVTTPIRFRGESLGASALFLFADSDVMAEMRALATVLKLDTRFVAAPWAIASVRPHRNAVGLILDAHETCLCRMRNNQITAMETCPYGSQALERDWSVSLGLPQFRPRALWEAYARGELDEEGQEVLENAMDYCFAHWFSALQGPLARLAEQGPLPPRLCYWETMPAWPGMARAMAAWISTWANDGYAQMQRLGLVDIPSISDRTGRLQTAPSAIALCALAHHAGRAHRGQNPLSALLQASSGQQA